MIDFVNRIDTAFGSPFERRCDRTFIEAFGRKVQLQQNDLPKMLCSLASKVSLIKNGNLLHNFVNILTEDIRKKFYTYTLKRLFAFVSEWNMLSHSEVPPKIFIVSPNSPQ